MLGVQAPAGSSAHEQKPLPAGGAQAAEAGQRGAAHDAQRDARKLAAEELSALEELSVKDAMQRCIHAAPERYSSVFDTPQMEERLEQGWSVEHDRIENAWDRQCEIVQRLLEGIQHVAVKRRARMKPGASQAGVKAQRVA